MRRLIAIAAIAVVAGVIGPSSADTQQNSCSATTGVSVTPILGDTAPTCTFEMTCTGVTTGCAYLVSLDVNGTGLVSGAMAVEMVTSDGAFQFAHTNGDPADAPSCSGTF